MSIYRGGQSNLRRCYLYSTRVRSCDSMHCAGNGQAPLSFSVSRLPSPARSQLDPWRATRDLEKMFTMSPGHPSITTVGPPTPNNPTPPRTHDGAAVLPLQSGPAPRLRPDALTAIRTHVRHRDTAHARLVQDACGAARRARPGAAVEGDAGGDEGGDADGPRQEGAQQGLGRQQ